MKNLEQYKDRFYNLMESTIGNVKPLINEANDYMDGMGITEPIAKEFMNKVAEFIHRTPSGLGQGPSFLALPAGKYPNCYNGLPTIYKGQPHFHFRVLYNPDSNSVGWGGFRMSTDGKLSETRELPSGIYQIKKDQNGNLTPESKKEMQEALKILGRINFQTTFDNNIADYAECTEPKPPSKKQKLKK